MRCSPPKSSALFIAIIVDLPILQVLTIVSRLRHFGIRDEDELIGLVWPRLA